MYSSLFMLILILTIYKVFSVNCCTLFEPIIALKSIIDGLKTPLLHAYDLLSNPKLKSRIVSDAKYILSNFALLYFICLNKTILN